MGENKYPDPSTISQSESGTNDRDQAANISTRSVSDRISSLGRSRFVRDMNRQDEEEIVRLQTHGMVCFTNCCLQWRPRQALKQRWSNCPG
jgi:hypothetical protein